MSFKKYIHVNILNIKYLNVQYLVINLIIKTAKALNKN